MRETEPLFDRPILARAYQDLRAQDGRPNDVIETPALQSVLPPLQGCNVLDLGCGAGGMAQWAIAQCARSVRGVDTSEQMISAARAASPSAIFEVADIEDVVSADESLDVVMSGLALHYIDDP